MDPAQCHIMQLSTYNQRIRKEFRNKTDLYEKQKIFFNV